MSDLMTHGVLNMPLPDDPKELDMVTWVQFRDRARSASSTIAALQEQNRALREAMEMVAYMGHDAPMTWSGTELDWANRRAGMMQSAARKALAATNKETAHD